VAVLSLLCSGVGVALATTYWHGPMACGL